METTRESKITAVYSIYASDNVLSNQLGKNICIHLCDLQMLDTWLVLLLHPLKHKPCCFLQLNLDRIGDLNFEEEIPALAGEEKPGEIKVEEANVPAPSNISLLLAVSEIDTVEALCRTG